MTMKEDLVLIEAFMNVKLDHLVLVLLSEI